MNFGFIKVAAATPKIRVADCKNNCKAIISQIKEASENKTALVTFPELCITGYTCSDLFLQSYLLDSCEQCVIKILKETENLNIISIIGVPIALNESIYNCAVVIYRGKILGIVPKCNIPNYGEFYEARHFATGKQVNSFITYAQNENVLINSNQIFVCEDNNNFCFGIELCEDLWVANSPSINLAKNGATIICNLSSSDEVIGKAKYRYDLINMQSGKLCCAYIYSDSGFGESTTDMVFSGHNLIAENATMLSQSKRFTQGIIYADVDVQKLVSERRRINTFTNNSNSNITIQKFKMDFSNDYNITRQFSKTPFVPTDKNDLANRCEEIILMQSTGLATRLQNTNIKKVVLGLSGGLDSTLALIVCVHAFDMLNIDRKNIYTVTMPCFGTTVRTKSNAELLAQAYGVSFQEINITKAVKQHFNDINHDENIKDVTYENCQARERTQVLMDLSNQYKALVIGTGDLSELALGWATYNGDQMSMYAVNVSIPKTLVRYLTKYESDKSCESLKNVLLDILDTPVSPELLPPDKNGKIAQKTEDVVGPYELHDFFLYYFVRFGFEPTKILFLANLTFKNKYDFETIKKWILVFFRRFFSQQFKRSCLPDGPKVGSVTLSPRADWRMPSDASSQLWLNQLEDFVL